MHCPYCKKDDNQVIDKRDSQDGNSIRRRRVCLSCKGRFTTYERIERMLKVIKKDGRREYFSREKIMNGIIKACEKRPISIENISDLVNRIELQLYKKIDTEVTSRYIGEFVMKELAKLDTVAYVRFASVYREFRDVSDFLQEVKPMLKKK